MRIDKQAKGNKTINMGLSEGKPVKNPDHTLSETSVIIRLRLA